MSILNKGDVIKRYVQNLNTEIYKVSTQAPTQNKEIISESLCANKSNLSNDTVSDRIGIDSVRSCESVFKIFDFEPIRFDDNNEKCIQFWRLIEEDSDLTPVDCVIMDAHLNRREVYCQTEVQESEGSLWARVLYELRQKKLDKLALATNTAACKFCEGISSYPCSSGYSPSELVDQENLVKLNDWMPKCKNENNTSSTTKSSLKTSSVNDMKKSNSQLGHATHIKTETRLTNEFNENLEGYGHHDEIKTSIISESLKPDVQLNWPVRLDKIKTEIVETEKLPDIQCDDNTHYGKFETNVCEADEVLGRDEKDFQVEYSIKSDENKINTSTDGLHSEDTDIKLESTDYDILPKNSVDGIVELLLTTAENSAVVNDTLEITPNFQLEVDKMNPNLHTVDDSDAGILTVSDIQNTNMNEEETQAVNYNTQKLNVTTSTQRLISLLNLEDIEEGQKEKNNNYKMKMKKEKENKSPRTSVFKNGKESYSTAREAMLTDGLIPIPFQKDEDLACPCTMACPCTSELKLLTDSVCLCEDDICKFTEEETDFIAIQQLLSEHLNDAIPLENDGPTKCFSRIYSELVNIQNENFKEVAVRLIDVLDHIDYGEGDCNCALHTVDSLQNKNIDRKFIRDVLRKDLSITMYKKRSEKIRQTLLNRLNESNLMSVQTQCDSKSDIFEIQQSNFICNSCGLENCTCK